MEGSMRNPAYARVWVTGQLSLADAADLLTPRPYVTNDDRDFWAANLGRTVACQSCGEEFPYNSHPIGYPEFCTQVCATG